MRSPGGWVEPAQRPEFHEYTYVLAGMLRVTSDDATVDVRAGQAIGRQQGRVRIGHVGRRRGPLDRFGTRRPDLAVAAAPDHAQERSAGP